MMLVDTRWVEDHLNDPKVRIAEVDYDSGSMKEMKKERIKKTSTVFFAIVTVTALFAVSLITASQHASAAVIVHHKVVTHHVGHTAFKDPSGSSSVHKVIAVIPETHGEPITAAALKKLVKGPYGESIIIGGMIAGGY
jgi:hypothetical protein